VQFLGQHFWGRTTWGISVNLVSFFALRPQSFYSLEEAMEILLILAPLPIVTGAMAVWSFLDDMKRGKQ